MNGQPNYVHPYGGNPSNNYDGSFGQAPSRQNSFPDNSLGKGYPQQQQQQQQLLSQNHPNGFYGMVNHNGISMTQSPHMFSGVSVGMQHHDGQIQAQFSDHFGHHHPPAYRYQHYGPNYTTTVGISQGEPNHNASAVNEATLQNSMQQSILEQ